MSQAPEYTPTISFEEEEQNLVAGRSTLRTPALDAELANIATSINALISNATAIQRDDGKLRDLSVELHTLSTEVLALLGSAGFTIHDPVGWLTATNYVAREIVTNGTGTYVSVSAHTSGVFATDLAAGKWVLIFDSVHVTASGVTFVPSGTLLSQNVQDAIEELDASTIKGTTTRGGLTNVLFPTVGGGWKDIVRSGWLPWSFNQQWGGAPMPFDLVDGVTGNLYRFDAASGYIDEDGGVSATADAAARTWRAQGFKVGRAISLQAVWVKIYKVGNPANNLELRILPDDGTGTKPTGAVAITNGTATAQNGKLHSADANGQMVRFVFPTPPALVAGTQYHITLKSSGAVDASNYWAWKGKSAKAYPHGNLSLADATPTWTAFTTASNVFLIEPVAADQILRSGGQFDAKLVFGEGTPLNQSAGLVQPLSRFFNSRKGTILVRGKSFTKDKTIFDALYGLDHDRIVLRANITTGFPQVDLYESDGTKATVTGTTDISQAVFNDIAVEYRAYGDGADYLRLRVNGTIEGSSLTGQTFSMDENFQQLGTAWLGGGFPIAPAWTQKLNMGVLPSADAPAWTYSASPAVEANAFSVSGGKLYQNFNGVAAADTPKYSSPAAGFVNANGGSYATKLRVPKNTNTISVSGSMGGVSPAMADGTKIYGCNIQEYYTQAWNSTGVLAPVQHDNKSVENVFLLSTKLSDAFIFRNGRLIADGTGHNTAASASNLVTLGDGQNTANENADVIYDYVAYYNTAWLAPQFTSGEIHEFAYWQDDRATLLPTLYNNGSQQSVKSYVGVEENWIGEKFIDRQNRMTVTSGQTTSSTAFVPLAEMEAFVIGDVVDVDLQATISSTQAVAADTTVGIGIDGAAASIHQATSNVFMRPPIASQNFGMAPKPLNFRAGFGLHKVVGQWAVSNGANTGSALAANKLSARGST